MITGGIIVIDINKTLNLSLQLHYNVLTTRINLLYTGYKR